MIVSQFRPVTLKKFELMVFGLYSRLLVIIITVSFKKTGGGGKQRQKELQGVTFFCFVTHCGESVRTTQTIPLIMTEQKTSICLPPLSNDKNISHSRITASLHPFKVTKYMSQRF